MTAQSATSTTSGEAAPTGRRFRLAWAALIVFGSIDLLWCRYAGLTFLNLDRILVATVLMIVVGRVYGASGRSVRLANMAHYAGLWIALTAIGAILTYLAATVRFPMRDPELAAFDGWLHFDWVAWFHFVAARPVISLILGLAYSSLFVQVLATIFYLSHTHKPQRNEELWWTAAVALVASAVLSAAFPAAGAGEYYATSDLPRLTYLPHLMALREGTLVQIALENMQGIITFPSYHTVLAVLLAYVYRGQGRIFLGVVILNIVMLLSIPVYGSHYLGDMLAGALIALLSICLVRAANARRSSAQSSQSWRRIERGDALNPPLPAKPAAPTN